MRYKELIDERKKKRRRKKQALSRYFFPGFAYYGGYGGEESSGSDGGGGESMYESAVDELKKELPSLKKHDYDTIDKLMRGIARKHKITGKALHNLFVKKYHKTPDDWIKNKLDEEEECDLAQEVDKFCNWACERLSIQDKPRINLSYDTEEAQTNHHTGGHVVGDDEIWVYAKNRNLVDILRTVFHELVHVRQEELNMIKHCSSYPGSPIEAMADMLAGKYIKIYGKDNPKIFQ
jgi:hypothetical protein